MPRATKARAEDTDRSRSRGKRKKRDRSCDKDRRRDRSERRGSSRGGVKDSELEKFRDRYPMDPRAFDCLCDASGEVQRTILTRFKPKREGEDDYSALVTTFVRSVQARLDSGTSTRAPPPQIGNRSDSPMSAFRERYPMDERAFSALDQSTPAVKEVVISSFKPRREGEGDYSALVMAFVRSIQTRTSDKRDRSRSRRKDFPCVQWESAVLLRGLPYRASVEDIRTFLGTLSSDLVGNKPVEQVTYRNGRPLGLARVQFSCPESARRCV
jgi:hypothetical protein